MRDIDPEIEDILRKYGEKLGGMPERISSQEYGVFREEALPKEVSLYEKLCKFSEFLNIGPSKKNEAVLRESIGVCHLNVSTIGVVSFAVLVMLGCVLFGLLSGAVTYFFGKLANPGVSFFEAVNVFLVLLWFIIGAVLIYPLSNLPNYMAYRRRLKASNQMVLCILYVVMYMRHTSNLEHAIRFASMHIGKPLNLDLRKVFWDVETGKFSTITASLDNYLEGWKKWNPEFVESFHLIEGSLYEAIPDRRLEMLDKALDVMLNGTYEKMLHFAQELKNPITMLHMLGIVLPILGLVIFPLIGSFLGGLIKWYHLAILYNIILPILVLWYGNVILSKRPTGYGEMDITEESVELKKYRNILFNLFGWEIEINPLYIGLLIGIIILSVGLFPVIVHKFYPGSLWDGVFDYRCKDSVCNGPYGIWALVLSLFLPLSLAFGLGSYYRLKTKKPIVIRENTKNLEREFVGSLFQLGNRVGDGMPVELAIGEVAKTTRGTATGNFFNMIMVNISKLGMDIQDAIFDKKRGAINYFPSNIIGSAMKILVESARKGTRVVARALISISEYVSSVHKIDERLKDLLADVLSSMKSQIMFLTPVIAGIVVSIGAMVVVVISNLSKVLLERGEEFFGGMPIEIFSIEGVIPSYFFQLVVGLYVVEIIIILTMLSSRIENGEDRLGMENNLGKNLFRSTLIYCGIALIGSLIFSGVAKTIIGGFG